MEHLVSPGDTVLLTSQNTPEALFWVALQPPAPAASQGSEGGGAGGEGLPNFPNTVAPGLGDHPLASSLKLCGCGEGSGKSPLRGQHCS